MDFPKNSLSIVTKSGLQIFQNVFSAGRSAGISQNYINDDLSFQDASSVIREIAENGPAVFVGRACNYVLRDMQCLNVFLCSPVDNRIKRVAERMNISASEAEALIQKKDKERKDFYDFSLSESGAILPITTFASIRLF